MSFPCGENELSNFKSKYSGVHPLAFHRSLERATSALDLFEILESMPSSVPFSWNDETHSWVADEDVMGIESLKSMLKRGK